MEILIVDDDRVTVVKLQRSLEKLGHRVTVARDGAEAWRRVCAGGVSLIVSDWMMPELDGLELCRRIRARAATPYTYVILLTARGSRDDRLEGLDAGADDFLSKPLDTGELVARINVARRILAMHDQLQSHADQLAALHVALERQNAMLAERAATDALTGLCNRRQFDESLRSALSFAGRHGQMLSLIMLDVDLFKTYNDTFGHQAGDDVLRILAGTLRTESRGHDIVARYGGEEFAVILPATDSEGAVSAAERLRMAVARQPWPQRSVTASFGVATAVARACDADRLLREADRALYHSKARGRNCTTHHADLVGSPPSRGPRSDDAISLGATSTPGVDPS
jgi:two-component system cell cycle response regulator